MEKLAEKVTKSLRRAARDEALKERIQQSAELRPLLIKAARKYVAGELREDGLAVVQALYEKGYAVSLEYIGENTADPGACTAAKNEFLRLIEEMARLHMAETISLDLSHIGLSVGRSLAQQHLEELAQKAKAHSMTIMISMEESAKTDDILAVYQAVSRAYPNVGITIQAHLHRSIADLEKLLEYPGRIRLVKGAYQEPVSVAMPRSTELNERYVRMAEQITQKQHPLSIATHDEALLKELEANGLLQADNVQLEMLHGIQPDLLKSYRAKGVRTSIYVTYGDEWHLYLCHRLAEYPENLYQLVIDLLEPDDENGGPAIY